MKYEPSKQALKFTWFFDKIAKNDGGLKVKLKAIHIFYVLYLLGLFYILFLYNRQIDLSWSVKGGWDTLVEAQRSRTNLIFFRTILRYLQTMNYATGMRNVIVNIGGHMLLFAPLGFFLPRIHPRWQKLMTFLLIVTVFMVIIEALQFVTMSGSFDVDDAMLNVLGAWLGFIFLRKPEGIERDLYDREIS